MFHTIFTDRYESAYIDSYYIFNGIRTTMTEQTANEIKIDLIIASIAEGETIENACKNAGLPNNLFYGCLSVRPDLKKRYAQAMLDKQRKAYGI